MKCALKYSLFLSLLLSSLSFAADAPITYSRSTIDIVPKSQSANLPWQNIESTGNRFNVEVRNAGSSINPDWFSFASYNNNSGLLMVEPSPANLSIAAINQFAPIDILFINEYGEIQTIMPNVVLAELQDPIVSEKPSMAVLYIKGGSSEASHIQPGDKISYSLFKKRPIVLRASEENATPNTTTSTSEAPETIPPPQAPGTTPTNNKPQVQIIDFSQKSVRQIPVKETPKTREELIDEMMKQNQVITPKKQ